MNICMLAPEFLPVWGGVGTYIVNLVKHLPKDVEVHVVTPLRKGFGKENASSYDYDFSEIVGDNVYVHFVCDATDTFMYNAKFQYNVMRKVPNLVDKYEIDLIHTHTAHMPDIMLMFKNIKIPLIATTHTTIRTQRLGTASSGSKFLDFERSEKATYLAYPALVLAEQLYFKKKRFYVSPSYWMKEWLVENNHIDENLVRVIPNPMDMEDEIFSKNAEMDLIPKEIRNKKIILYVGRLLAMKGINVLIKAIPKILRNIDCDECVFVFAGPGKPKLYIEGLKKKGLAGKCFFTGPLSRDSVLNLMKLSEIVVLPSFLENSPYVILEAMACGTPVVASNVGGIPEIIENEFEGILVKSGNSELLADKVIALLKSDSKRRKIANIAKNKINQKFSWKMSIPKYIETYSEIAIR